MNLEKGIGDININRVPVLPKDVCVCSVHVLLFAILWTVAH